MIIAQIGKKASVFNVIFKKNLSPFKAEQASDGELFLDIKIQSMVWAFVPALLDKFKNLNKGRLCSFSVEVKLSAFFTSL